MRSNKNNKSGTVTAGENGGFTKHLHETHRIFVQFLNPRLKNFYDGLNDFFFDLAESASNNEEQNQYFAAIGDTRKNKSELIENEKKIQEDMIKDSGKPSNVMEKILDGKMKKFYSEVTLLSQNFVIDTDKTVKEAISDFNSSNNFKLNNYVLISL